MKSTLAWLLVLGSIALSTGDARAFDGRRSGFILGGGLGAGFSRVHTTVTGYGSESSNSDNKAGIASDFKIGGGIGQRFQLYYVNRVNWYSSGDSLNVIIALSEGLLGASYYFKDEEPCFYITGLLGLSSWQAPFDSDVDSYTGFGIGGGAGWEFTKHWSLEASINWGNPGSDNIDIGATSFLVTISGLAY